MMPFNAVTLLVGHQEGHPACKKVQCWFVGWRFDWSFACPMAPAVTTSSVIISSYKSETETFWYRLTQIHLEKWP